jgi:hypothetical protein
MSSTSSSTTTLRQFSGPPSPHLQLLFSPFFHHKTILSPLSPLCPTSLPCPQFVQLTIFSPLFPLCPVDNLLSPFSIDNLLSPFPPFVQLTISPNANFVPTPFLIASLRFLPIVFADGAVCFATVVRHCPGCPQSRPGACQLPTLSPHGSSRERAEDGGALVPCGPRQQHRGRYHGAKGQAGKGMPPALYPMPLAAASARVPA